MAFLKKKEDAQLARNVGAAAPGVGTVIGGGLGAVAGGLLGAAAGGVGAIPGAAAGWTIGSGLGTAAGGLVGTGLAGMGDEYFIEQDELAQAEIDRLAEEEAQKRAKHQVLLDAIALMTR